MKEQRKHEQRVREMQSNIDFSNSRIDLIRNDFERQESHSNVDDHSLDIRKMIEHRVNKLG